MSDVGGPGTQAGGPPDGNDVDGDHPTELRQYKSVREIFTNQSTKKSFRTLPQELVQHIHQPNFVGVLELGVVTQLFLEIKLKVRLK